MKTLLSCVMFVAYVIAAVELFESLTATVFLVTEMHWIACGVFAGWGTASLAAVYALDVLRPEPKKDDAKG